MHLVVQAKFCIVVPKMFWSSVWKQLGVNRLQPTVLRCPSDNRNICGSLYQPTVWFSQLLN